MNKTILPRLFVLAFGITGNLLFSQQNNSAICRLGDIKNDSLLPFIENLSVNVSIDEELAVYANKSSQMKKLKQLQVVGETSPANWQSMFNKIKSSTTLKTIVFDDNSFEVLPVGYEGLFYVENLEFSNNDDADYFQLLQQLRELKNLRTLQLDIYSVFDLPDSIVSIQNLKELVLINKDEAISDANFIENTSDYIAYDFYFKKSESNTVHVKYISLAGAMDAGEYKELSKRFSTTHNHQFVSQVYEPKYNYVNPPIKGIDVTRKYYNINPAIENILVYPSGTKIWIPANAFVDMQGNTVTDNVKIAYREFRDQVDILVSGIPMKYDSAGTVNDFESAGMFEILASVGDKPVALADNKNINLNFQTTSADSTFNFYAYDDKTGNWDFQNKPQSVTETTKIAPKIYSQAYVQYRYLLKSRPKVPDSLTMSQRFSNQGYVYTKRMEGSGKQLRYDYRSEGRKLSVPYFRVVKVSNVRKLKDGSVLFKLKFNSQLHPELNAFNDVYFASTENISSAAFRKKYAKGKFYNDVRVYDNGGLVDIQLKELNKTTTLFAGVGRIKDNKEFVEAKDFHNKMKKYNRSLRYREKLFNKSIKRKKSDNYKTIELTDPQEIESYAYNTAKKLMSEEEKRMSYEQWKSYYDQIIANEMLAIASSQATSGNLMQSLSISGMGIYNCDQIKRIQEPIEVFASYKSSSTGKELEIVNTMLIDKRRNSVFQYNGSYGYKPSKIVVSGSKNTTQVLVAVKPDGGVAIYATENFKDADLKNKKKYEFVVNEIETSFTTVDDLRKLIGL